MDFHSLYLKEVEKSTSLGVQLADALKELKHLKNGVVKCNACMPLLFGKFEWVPASGGGFPQGSYVGGSDHGQPLYVVRCVASDGVSVVPGKLNPTHSQAYYSWETLEGSSYLYEVLVANENDLEWVPFSHGRKAPLPEKAILAGKFVYSAEPRLEEDLYIGRTTHLDTGVQIGKVGSAHRFLSMSYGSQSFSYCSFEILCVK